MTGLALSGDSTFYKEWDLSRALYPRLQVRDTWEKPPPTNDDVVTGPSDIGFISDLDFTQDGKVLAASSTNNDVYVFATNSGKLKFWIPKAHSNAVTRVKFVNNYQFVTGSADCTLGLWDLRNPKIPVNILRGHGTPIRSIDFDDNSDMLVTSSQDGHLRYWHLPTFQLSGENQVNNVSQDNDEVARVRGVLLTCPNFNLACISSVCNKAVCTNAHGNVYVIDNLDLSKLKDDLKNVRFDETLKMQLSWFHPNASLNKTNKVRVIASEDYSPVSRAMVSNITYIVFHPTLPLLLMRITTSMRTQFRQEMKDWTCICNLQQQLCLGGNLFSKSSFGSDVLEETLLFVSEEVRFASYREKRACFSRCGRLIASPDKHGVRLLSFSTNMDTCNIHSSRPKVPHFMTSELSMPTFWPTGPSQLTVVGRFEKAVNSTMCCKFSPLDMLLAVGDSSGCVQFYQPRIA